MLPCHSFSHTSLKSPCAEQHPRRSDAATEAGLTLAPLDVLERELDPLEDGPPAAGGGGGKRSINSGSPAETRRGRGEVARQPRPKQFLPVVTDRESSAGMSSAGSLGSGWLSCGLESLRCNRQYSKALAGTAAAGGGLFLLSVCAAQPAAAHTAGTAGSVRRVYSTAVDGTLRSFDLKPSGGDAASGGVAAQSRSTKIGGLALSAVRILAGSG